VHEHGGHEETAERNDREVQEEPRDRDRSELDHLDAQGSRFGEALCLSQREKPGDQRANARRHSARGRRGGKRDAQTARCGEPQHRGDES